MKILAIETCGKYGSAAVLCDGGEAIVTQSDNQMSHLRDIISISDEALRASGTDKEELTHIAASVGPGSFTGIRIGVTTARTLAQMLNISCVAVSSLEAMARRVLPAAKEAGYTYIAAIINARRHQVYAGAWKVCGDDAGLCVCCEEKQYMIEDLIGILNGRLAEDPGKTGKVFWTGDGIDAYGDILDDMCSAGSKVLAPEEIRYQNAGTVALIARDKIINGEEISYEDLLPNYMRLAEAEQRLMEGTLSSKITRPEV